MAKLIVFGSEVEVYASEDPQDTAITEEHVAAHGCVRRRIDPLKLEVSFLDYCIRHGWVEILPKGDRDSCFLTEAGETELRRFGLREFY